MNRRLALSYAIPSALALWSLSSTATLAATAAPAVSTRLPLATAINRAGKMRALSQRISKAYVQAALNVLPERARETMLSSQRIAAQGMDDLLGNSPSPELQTLLQALQKDTATLTGLTTQPARTTGVTDAARAADAMLTSAEQVTRAYEKSAPQSAARVVNVAGRQRMLSQRAARAYFMLASGQTSADVRSQLDTARKEFNEGMSFLQASAVSTVNIRNELELAKGQWLFFETALQKQANPEVLQTVATTSERMFDVMDNLTGLYDAVVRDLFA